MPGLAKKLIIFAAVDGLFLQPAGQRQSSGGQGGGVKIEYGTNKITTPATGEGLINGRLETHGIVGLLNLVTSSYLVAITHRREVASIRDNPVFLVTDVALIPLSSRAEAEKAITHAQKLLKADPAAGQPTKDEPGAAEETETETESIHEEELDATPLPQEQKPDDEANALEPESAQDGRSNAPIKGTVQNKGKYARFVSQWFSKNSKNSQTKREQGLSNAQHREELTQQHVQQEDHALTLGEDEDDDAQGQSTDREAEPKGRTSNEKKRQRAIEYLSPRILKTARLYFGSSGFYFSYDHDLSASVSREDRVDRTVPLWKRFDTLFFWNRHLMEPFVDAGVDGLVLPLTQGFVGQRAFSIAQSEDQDKDIVAEADGTELTDLNKPRQDAPKHNLLVTLISRRSVKRAGLRYLRRGTDDEGNVANSVETEQILSYQSWNDDERVSSLVQVRGSMPLFFSQSPYSFKPLPVLFGSESTNQAAMKRHFAHLINRYGDIQVASLVDKHGTEVAIGEKYEASVQKLNESGGVEGGRVSFEWFDFHGACKGMRFENVAILLNTLSPFLKSSHWTVRQDGVTVSQQTGVLRTNCMDCLDRTNVIQSAVGSRTLEQQLAELGLNIDLNSDAKTVWFNTLWADNGDAISKQYAGTSALKGDFTRTRKRNWTGALTDFSLTLNRYYNNIFGDYFLQTNIDYFLGAGPNVFDEFEEDMTSKDYALDMSSLRQNAIDTCIKIVLENPMETLISAWTLACPKQGNTLRSLPFEECVLLLTQSALYLCRFDWNTEKVGSFERVDLLDIKEIWRGGYITSALGQSHLDETKNVGFVVRYSDRGPEMRRTNTRSMSVVGGPENEDEDTTKDDSPKQESDCKEARILAFKALPQRTPISKRSEDDIADLSELEVARKITDEVQKAVVKAFERDQDTSAAPKIQEHAVISAADARKSTGYVESIGYSLKKLVWS